MRSAYRAVMRLFSCVPSHVNDQHVLRLEGLLLPGAALPLTHEGLLVAADVLVVQVLQHSYLVLKKLLNFGATSLTQVLQ